VRERALLLKAQELYGAAFEAKRRAEADDAYYSGVNVAAVFAILTKLTSPKPDISNGFRQQLEGVVTDVESVAKQALEAAKVGNKEPFWSAATLGDLAVLQDQRQTAEAWYKEAVTLPGTTAFSLDSVRQQLVIFRDLGLFEDAVDGSLKVLTKAISETAPQVPEGFDGFLTRSPTVIRILEDAKRFAGDDVPILITGETGTGKELIARALHDLSTRHAERLVCMNVAASTASLVHNDLFGHVKGAYTGAVNEREGIFGIADGGTLFLDEIGDCPPDLQATLLRVLQEGEIKHQGSDITEKVDVRLVSATNRNLRHEVREQRFRSDLLYRLGVPIHLPPLRERQGDIGFLAACFAAEESLRVGKRIERIGSDAMAALYAHPWPGNIRELQDVIREATINAYDSTVRAANLRKEVRDALSGAAHVDSIAVVPTREQHEVALERRALAVGQMKLAIQESWPESPVPGDWEENLKQLRSWSLEARSTFLGGLLETLWEERLKLHSGIGATDRRGFVSQSLLPLDELLRTLALSKEELAKLLRSTEVCLLKDQGKTLEEHVQVVNLLRNVGFWGERYCDEWIGWMCGYGEESAGELGTHWEEELKYCKQEIEMAEKGIEPVADITKLEERMRNAERRRGSPSPSAKSGLLSVVMRF